MTEATITIEQLKRMLERPFHPRQLSWRVGATNGDKTKGIALAYIDARDVMLRLDQCVGFAWQNRYNLCQDGLLVCEIGIQLNGDWVWRANGAGDTQVEAEKGKASDAFKRAAVMWGIGRYLYNLPNTWVKIEPQGRSYKLAETPNLPEWATPEGYDAIMEKRDAALRTE
jgi:hypothetical protein